MPFTDERYAQLRHFLTKENELMAEREKIITDQMYTVGNIEKALHRRLEPIDETLGALRGLLRLEVQSIVTAAAKPTVVGDLRMHARDRRPLYTDMTSLLLNSINPSQ